MSADKLNEGEDFWDGCTGHLLMHWVQGHEGRWITGCEREITVADQTIQRVVPVTVCLPCAGVANRRKQMREGIANARARLAEVVGSGGQFRKGRPR